MLMIGGICVLGAAIAASMLLVPSPDIVKGQLERERSPIVSTSDSRPQRLGFIVGSQDAMMGTQIDVMVLVNSRSAADFPGQVQLPSVEVQTVPGDQVFSVGPTPAHSVLVKIDEGGPGGEGALTMRPGQRVAISGTVTPISSFDELRRQLGVTGYEAGRLGNSSLMLHAKAVKILDN
jgi:hypothetical protein